MTRRVIQELALLVLVAAPALAQDGQPLIVRETAAPCLAVRTRPVTDAPSIACLPPGTAVTGVAIAPYWRRVRLADGKLGWSAKKYLGAPTEGAPAGGQPPTVGSAIPDDAWLEIHIVDVGQGDGIWIHTFDDGIPGNGRFEGKNIVIDGGPNASDAKNLFLKYMQATAHQGALIDALIMTHPHVDHFPGARGIVRHFDVCDYYDPGYPKEGTLYPQFVDEVRNAHCGDHKPAMHMGREQFGQPDWGSDVGVEFLYSWPGSPAGLGNGNTVENNASIVLKITYGSQSILFMGDAEGKDRADAPDVPKYAEARLLADAGAAKLKSTVLKIAHHGSETSSTLPFIRAVDPSVVIVSSGRKSFSGTHLPDASTLRRYCDHNPVIRIYRTDQDDEAEGRTTATDADGDHILIRMNGRQTVVQALSNGRPFVPTACSP